MNVPSANPNERFAALLETFQAYPNVTLPSDIPQSKKFGSSLELRVNNKIFAMLVRDHLVVKLAQQHVDALIASGDGERFDPGHGRLMKEWITLAPTSDVDWLSLMKDAMTFVAAKR